MAPDRVIRGITKTKFPLPRPNRRPLRRLDAIQREAARRAGKIRRPVGDEDTPPVCDGDRRFCDHEDFDDGAEVTVNNPGLQIHGRTGTVEYHCLDGTLIVRLDHDDLCYPLGVDEVI